MAVALCTSSPSRPPVPLPFYPKSGDLRSDDVFTTRVLLALNRASFQVGILKSILPLVSPFLLYPCPHSEWRRRRWAGQTRLEGGVQPTLGWLWGAQGKWLYFGGPPEMAPARGQSARHWLEQRPCRQPAIQTRVLFRRRVGEPAADGSCVFWEADVVSQGRCIVSFSGVALPSPLPHCHPQPPLL